MIVTLLTDFGTTDYFVGAMKGALLSVCPDACIIDITHEVPAHDIEAGAFILFAAHEAFPPCTIHVAVVDPGVGSARRPILVVSGGHFFVGPDNGLFSYIYERAHTPQVFHLTNEKFFRPSRSTTFHGRDVFAPVAGALAGAPGVKIVAPVQANGVFAVIAPTATEILQRDWSFYVWDPATGAVRWMCSWDTTAGEVDAFAQDIRNACETVSAQGIATLGPG